MRLDAINRWELYWIAEIGKVDHVFNDGEHIWLAQDGKVLQNETNYPNLQIPASWKSYSSDDHFNSASVLTFFELNSNIYAGATNGLYQFQTDQWVRLGFNDESVNSITMWNDRLSLITRNGIYAQNKAGEWQTISNEIHNANDLISDAQNELWASQPGYGLINFSGSIGSLSVENCFPNGPGTNSFSDMVIDQDGHLWTTSAGNGINFYNGSTWKSFKRKNGLPSDDFRAIEVDENNRIWAGSWGGGVVRFIKVNDDSVTFDVMRSMDGNLAGISSDPNYIVVRDILCDPDNNLWFSNYLAADRKVLAVRDPEGNWQHWSTADGIRSSEVSRLTVDNSDRIWIATDVSGLSVLDYGESLLDKSDDDLSGYLNTAEGLESDRVNAVAYDLDGTMWIGTLEGLNYWFAGSVSTNYNVINDVINAILIDPRNNKWFGTQGGLSVMQFDGVSWDHYSTNDSPLVSNNITCFALDKSSGDLYIGTTNGLSVLRTPFTQPEETLDKVMGYPNPFVLDQNGALFYMNKLAINSAIKIFTSEGRLVRTIPEDQVPGAQAVWDGKNNNGETVQSGVYVYLITAEDGERTVGKVAVINP
ncbi:MAG: two-component regulator propeller domain-containing protein [candidate division KSB1 bacterium]|nr:two-component regulator propeller domain-containing protein [candidate division KSB1 bacterium]